VHAGRNLVQALIATLSYGFLPAAQTRLHQPNTADVDEFDMAKARVQAVVPDISSQKSGGPK
jgi:hypothetical protein